MKLLDTNILLHFVRQGTEVEENCYISIVTLGEIQSLAVQFKWGEERKNKLENNLKKVEIINIDKQIVKSYLEIDVFSQGLYPKLKLQSSARNMGKNDIWIGATAHALKLTLQTADNDFDHLDKVLIFLQKN